MKKLSFYEVTRRIEWDMAHRIPLHGGKCQHLHGHRYVAEVSCRSGELDEMGAVVDFGLIKQLVGTWVDENWDHNTCYYGGDAYMEALDRAHSEFWAKSQEGPEREWYVMGSAPTAENLAERLYGVAKKLLAEHGIQVVRIDLWETPNCRASFEPWTAEVEETQHVFQALDEEREDGVFPAHPSFEDPTGFGTRREDEAGGLEELQEAVEQGRREVEEG